MEILRSKERWYDQNCRSFEEILPSHIHQDIVLRSKTNRDMKISRIIRRIIYHSLQTQKRNNLSHMFFFSIERETKESYKQLSCTFPDRKYHWIPTFPNYFCLHLEMISVEFLPSVNLAVQLTEWSLWKSHWKWCYFNARLKKKTNPYE